MSLPNLCRKKNLDLESLNGSQTLVFLVNRLIRRPRQQLKFLSFQYVNQAKLPHTDQPNTTCLTRSLDSKSQMTTMSISQSLILAEPRHLKTLVKVHLRMKFCDSESQLQVLDMHGNQLRVHLPVNLFTYNNLTSVNLGHNFFSGRIPLVYGERLGNNWRNLFLDYNFLEGDLPAELSSAVNFSGSLAHNCRLNCPRSVEACRGGQRPASECVEQI